MNDGVDQLPALVAALLEPRCYPHPVGSVDLRQTHLSWVLLAGDYAYKIKKPVRFDFVDLSTLALRHEDCLAEVRLNRRYAPQLYLGLTAISGTPEAPVLSGTAPAIEYAVKLRRFDPQEEVSALLARGALTAADMADFGSALAQIHESSPVSEIAASAYGVVAGNVDELERCAPGASVAEIRKWLDAAWLRLADTAEGRWKEGRVRECHGDLHTGNIVRCDGQLVAFDCITFNDSLRCIDVISDVAFLFMDLTLRRHRDLAYAFLNGWLEASGDYAGVPLLTFFAVHRALVRAKVAALGARPGTVGSYVALAQSLTRRRNPVLSITCGLSGSGKTWLSERVVTAAGAVRIRSDVERKRLAGLRADESSRSRGVAIYSRDFNQRVYERLIAQARVVLEAGENVIVDAAFLRFTEREQFMQLAAGANAGFVVLHCVAPDAELRTRLVERQRLANDASEADVAVMEQQYNYWEPFTDTELPFVRVVQTSDAASVATAIAAHGVRD